MILSNKYYLLIIISLFILFCSDTPEDVAGGTSSEQGNALTGTVVYTDGSPAAYSTVDLYDIDFIPDTLVDSGSSRVTTDSEGRFLYSGVPSGYYSLSATDQQANGARLDSVYKEDDDDTLNVGNIVIKPLGSISGYIYLVENEDPREVLVLVFAMNNYSRPDSTGYFSLQELPEGSYHIRIVTNHKNYDVFDTTDVKVISGENTDLDTIRLPLAGVPKVPDISSNYNHFDTIATVSWKTCISDIVTGYTLYRQNISNPSSIVTLIENTQDTLFLDTALSADSVYVYSVIAIDSLGRAGPLVTRDTVNTKVIDSSTILDGNIIQEWNIYSDTTWSKSDGPFILSHPLTIEPNAVLTVSPGVTIYTGKDCNINVRGVLRAMGTENEPVTFTSNLENHFHYDEWGGIAFYSDKDSSLFTHCIIEYAGCGINSGISIIIKNCIFRRNKTALLFDRQANWVIIESSIIDNNLSGIAYNFYGPGNLYINNNEILDNRYFGIKLTGEFITSFCYSDISYNSIDGNNTGIVMDLCGLTDTISIGENNNIINSTEFACITMKNCEQTLKVIDFRNNYFGTIDSTEIDSMIFDFKDDSLLSDILVRPVLDTGVQIK